MKMGRDSSRVWGHARRQKDARACAVEAGQAAGEERGQEERRTRVEVQGGRRFELCAGPSHRRPRGFSGPRLRPLLAGDMYCTAGPCEKQAVGSQTKSRVRGSQPLELPSPLSRHFSPTLHDKGDDREG